MPSFYTSEPDGELESGGGITPASVGGSAANTATYRRVHEFSSDRGDATRRIETLYRGRSFRSQRAPGEFEFSYVLAGDDRLVLQTSTFSAPMQGEIPFPGQYIVAWNRAGRTTLHHRSRPFTSTGSVPFLMPAEDAFSFESTPRHNNMVQIGTAFLESTATERHDGPPQRLVFDQTVAPRPDHVAAWRAAVKQTTSAVVSETTAPLVRLEAQLVLARALLDLFPWQAVDVPMSLRTQQASRVRHAVEYIHAHADQPITPADIAAVAGLHTRTLQSSMREYLGASPANYLRQVRLDRVRADLLAASPHETQVSEVAKRWGFGNLGRFSAFYAERFDEYPRATLGR